MKDIVYRTYNNNKELIEVLKDNGFSNFVDDGYSVYAEKANEALKAQVDKYAFSMCYTSDSVPDKEVVIYEVAKNGDDVYHNINKNGSDIKLEIEKLK